jgi:hypothetical protein
MIRNIGILSLTGLLVACGAQPGDGEGGSQSEEDSTLKTRSGLATRSLQILEAGDGYIPGVDRKPMISGGECILEPKVSYRPLGSSLTAKVVANSMELARELGIEATGISIPIKQIPNLTGSANLAKTTTFSNRSVTVLLRATGE